jgi:hypothetical protein
MEVTPPAGAGMAMASVVPAAAEGPYGVAVGGRDCAQPMEVHV